MLWSVSQVFLFLLGIAAVTVALTRESHGSQALPHRALPASKPGTAVLDGHR